jgi:hypothetical protein
MIVLGAICRYRGVFSPSDIARLPGDVLRRWSAWRRGSRGRWQVCRRRRSSYAYCTRKASQRVRALIVA